jgi:chromosome segregation ATPase
MAPLLKNLLGNSARDRELTDEMRAVLNQIRQERSHCEALVKSARASLNRVDELAAPIAKADSDAQAVTTRVATVEQRLAAVERLTAQFQALDERAERMGQSQRQSETRIAHASEDVQRIRSAIEELSHKVDVALVLKDELGSILEMEAPLRQLRGETDTLRGQVVLTSEQLGRIREQHDRVMDAHKAALTKFDAFDQRQEGLARGVQDSERRLEAVTQALHGLDDVRETVEDAKRRLGSLKILGEYVSQKTATLQAQRDELERVGARVDQLDQAMRQVDAGVRQQQEHTKTLETLQERVGVVQALHEAVIERSHDVDEIQRATQEQVQQARLELGAARDEARKSVERFDFESRGLESVSQRVADLRATLSDFETRFKDVAAAGQQVAELHAQTETITTRLRGLTEEVGRLDEETRQVQGIRRDLEEADRVAQEVRGRLAYVEETRPAMEAALRDMEQLRGAHAMVKDALEQTRGAGSEITRVRESQTHTLSWLGNVQQSLASVKEQTEELRRSVPTIEFVQKQVQRVNESVSAVEARREFLEELHRRMADLGALGGKLDERGRDLQIRMDAAEQRFVALAAHADEAERLGKAMASVSSGVQQAERDTEEVGRQVAALTARQESVEELAERTRVLRQELDQRQHALEVATKELARASELRQQAAASAQELDERAKGLTTALASADRQATRVETLSSQLEERADNLRFVEKRLGQFEERLAKWELVEQEIGRGLEQLATRHSTVEALQADVDRMFAVAEKTATDVRTIAAAQGEIEASRALLEDVMARLREIRELASGLDERKRQTDHAEARLARAEALLFDVRSSLETLQGQKVIVDQAVEKTGTLRFLLKQAESVIEGLREERDVTARVRAAVGSVQDEEDEQGMARAG